jgi:hypothetical protein
MPSAACLPMEGIQCECPLRSSGLTGQVNLAHSRFRCTFGASSAAPPVWAQPSVRPRTILQLSWLGPQAQLSPISYRHRSAASLLACGRVVDRDRLHIRKHTRRRLRALRWWLLNEKVDVAGVVKLWLCVQRACRVEGVSASICARCCCGNSGDAGSSLNNKRTIPSRAGRETPSRSSRGTTANFCYA